MFNINLKSLRIHHVGPGLNQCISIISQILQFPAATRLPEWQYWNLGGHAGPHSQKLVPAGEFFSEAPGLNTEGNFMQQPFRAISAWRSAGRGESQTVIWLQLLCRAPKSYNLAWTTFCGQDGKSILICSQVKLRQERYMDIIIHHISVDPEVYSSTSHLVFRGRSLPACGITCQLESRPVNCLITCIF